MTACMESPKKGRFDDFEFELENSNPEVPTRRRKLAAPRRSASPSTNVGLPRSKTSAVLNGSTTNTTMLGASRKENSPAATHDAIKLDSSPVKPHTVLPKPSRLHGASSNHHSTSRPAPTASLMAPPVTARTSSAAPQSSASDIRPATTSKSDPNHRLLFGSSESATRNPFRVDAQTSNSLAALGESRHSPVKRFQPKSQFIIASPDRPDRKPINLLELKPSPGKAQRGIFRHNSARDDYDDDDGWDEEEFDGTQDEIRLVAGPGPKKEEAASRHTAQKAASSDSAKSSGSSSLSSSKQAMPRSTTTLDVRHTLSTETSDALASLEASLAKLKAKTRNPPNASTTQKKETSSGDTSTKRSHVLGHSSGDTSLKRGLGLGRPPVSGLTSSRTQMFLAKNMPSSADTSMRSQADQSGDSSSVFKRPSGRVSALAKSRATSSDLKSMLNPALSSSKSMMSFGAPRLPGYSEASRRPTGSVLPGSRQSSLQLSSEDAREEQAAAEEERARIAEAKQQAEIKAAKRKSMSALSSGMPPTSLQRAERSVSASSSSAASKSTASTTTSESTGAESAGSTARAARRRSLLPNASDRSSSSLSTTHNTTNSEADSSQSAPRKTRFLRGLTVLVDVRDQDGEDASACWVEMLKNAGAKVMVRFGERKLTHIVYKSGRPGTLHSYRALDDPKPHVVGVSWVVACLEQGQKAEETPYLVEVAKQAIFVNVSTEFGPRWKRGSKTDDG